MLSLLTHSCYEFAIFCNGGLTLAIGRVSNCIRGTVPGHSMRSQLVLRIALTPTYFFTCGLKEY